jgi:hypothetical protein
MLLRDSGARKPSKTLRAHVARWRGFGHLAMILNNVFSIDCVDTWPAI